MKQIKTLADLDYVLTSLEEQGFLQSYRIGNFVDRKLDKIIRMANTLNLDYQHSDLVKLFDGKNFVKFEEVIKKHFAKFKPADKIKELVARIGLQEKSTHNPTQEMKDQCRADNDRIYWVRTVRLNPNFVKLKTNNGDMVHQINQLLELLGYEVNVPSFSEHNRPNKSDGLFDGGTWKIYKNGVVEIAGKPVKKLNQLFKEHYKSFDNCIVKL